MTSLPPDDLERLARKRAGAKLGWYIHAVAYVLINGSLWAMTQAGVGRTHWNVGPALGWGLGLVLHGVSVFVLGRGSALRERMVEREREKLRAQQQRDQGKPPFMGDR